MDNAVATGLFALGGVCVGGFVQAAVAHRMERRREGWAARRSARLFMPSLVRVGMATSGAVEHGYTWEQLQLVAEANLERWDEHAEVFAGTLGFDQWGSVYAAVRALQQMTWEDSEDPRVRATDADYMKMLTERCLDAAVVLTIVADAGVHRRRISRGLRRLRNRVLSANQDARFGRILEDLGVPADGDPLDPAPDDLRGR